jgi:hypothetical protein
MAKMVSMAKTSTVNHPTPVVHAHLPECCQDLEDWPRSWIGVPEDLSPGKKMVAYFRPFIEHLIGLNLAGKPPTSTWTASGFWEEKSFVT